MKRFLPLITTPSLLTALFLGAAISPPPAAAETKSIGYHWIYETTLPEYVSQPTPFTINFNIRDTATLEWDGLTPEDATACSMTFQGQTDTTAPWEFTYNPNYKEPSLGGGWRTNPNLSITLCNGEELTGYISKKKPYTINNHYIASGKKKAIITLTNNQTSTPTTATLLDGNTTLAEISLPPEETRDITFSTKNIKKTKTLTLRFTTDAGETQNIPITVTHNWRTIWQDSGLTFTLGGVNNDGGAAFAPCSTIYWQHEVNKKPANVKTALFNKDIQRSLNLLSKHTGLTFKQASPSTPANAPVIRLFWGNARGAAGLGGPSSTGGEVEFNKKIDWVSDRNSGFKSGGRNWLIVHETMHVLGLGHSEDSSDLMYPTYRTQTKLGKSDIVALRTLYPKATCS